MNKIFYCRVGWMRSYCGAVDEKPVNGGSYNKNNTGYEVYNFLGNKGRYYGFVEAGVDKTINIKKLDGNNDYAENITVVWIAKSNEAKGQRIVGWYKDAKVFKQLQKDIPEDVMEERDKAFNIYNIYAEKAVLLDVNDRKYIVKGMGQSNIWYGNEDENKKVEKIIETYEKDKSDKVNEIEKYTEELEGKEKEAVVKVRINQDKFREKLINKYKKCCLCNVNMNELLVASHIKPWSISDANEKLDIHNGLLMCPNHDKLFDRGYISFDDTGRILISERLDDNNRMYMNITAKMKIDITEENIKYIKYHRKNVFIEK